jgi:hypothetical protein
MMYGHEKNDPAIVAVKPTNKTNLTDSNRRYRKAS